MLAERSEWTLTLEIKPIEMEISFATKTCRDLKNNFLRKFTEWIINAINCRLPLSQAVRQSQFLVFAFQILRHRPAKKSVWCEFERNDEILRRKQSFIIDDASSALANAAGDCWYFNLDNKFARFE